MPNKLSPINQAIFSPEFHKIIHILNGISKKSSGNPNAQFEDLYSLLSKPIIHIQALGNIRPNKGMGTPGIDKKTLEGMNLKIINKIAEEFKEKTFKFSPVRRVYIPKLGKNKLRPLGIPTLKDRIAQESIRLILESIYEPIFSTLQFQNYGFRPGKSPHYNIHFLKEKGTACNIAIEGDIVGAYDNVNIKILINIIRKKIKDESFLKLIEQGCHCGILEFNKITDSITGVPQGGIASPILFNIYMHEFDLFINNKLNEIITNHNLTENRINEKSYYTNPEYKRIGGRIDYYRKQIKTITSDGINNLDTQKKEILKRHQNTLKLLIKERIKTPSIRKELRPIRIIYSRYADDWIILTNSKMVFAEYLKEKISDWLKQNLKLELSPEKTKLTDITNNYAHFLGFNIYTYNNTKITHNKDGSLIRTGGYNIKAGIDSERVLNRLLLKGFCNKNFKPIGKRPYSVLSLKEIFDKYNSVIRGIANYYLPQIDYVHSFSQIYYILSYSCYGTLATKFNSSIYKIFTKHGKPPIFNVELKIKSKALKNKTIDENIDKISLYITPYQIVKEKALKLKLTDKIEENFFNPLKKINWRTYKNLRGFCCICGSREDVEWHHVNWIKKGKVSGFTQVMKQLNRKQMPFCHTHHQEVTKGTYDGLKISELAEIEYWLS